MVDDGRGPNGAGPGNGLAGLRDRVTAVQGTVMAGAGQAGGYRLFVEIPLAGRAA